jgi:hypothetical protein
LSAQPADGYGPEGWGFEPRSKANNPLMISSWWNLIGELINNQSSKMGETFETYDIM